MSSYNKNEKSADPPVPSSLSFFSQPIIVTGPAGCGKSYYIRKKAEEEGKILLHCPCRKDRTLREGRQILHTWAKRSENSVIWLEGADDLTPESQAFLRRISETHSPFVSFVLECRDGSKLQEPIRSRYLLYSIGRPTWNDFIVVYPEIELYPEIKKIILQTDYSYRKIQHCLDLIRNHPEDWARCIETEKCESKMVQEIQDRNIGKYHIKKLQEMAINPNKLIQTIICKEKRFLEDYGQHIFNNGNPWAFFGFLKTHL